MKKILAFLLLSVFIAGSAFAITVHQNRTRINNSDNINFINGIGALSNGSGTDIYLATPLIDLDLYTASAGVGASKSLRISADGTIYAF